MAFLDDEYMCGGSDLHTVHKIHRVTEKSMQIKPERMSAGLPPEVLISLSLSQNPAITQLPSLLALAL